MDFIYGNNLVPALDVMNGTAGPGPHQPKNLKEGKLQITPQRHAIKNIINKKFMS
jgi:hypothetical protein